MPNPLYRGRVNRAVDYIAAHLGEPLSLETLAGVSCFSPYHFHRIFKSLTGETLNAFIRRCRMERAAKIIRTDPGRPLTELALELGFSSGANFSRDFRRYYGLPPSRAAEIRDFPRWEEEALLPEERIQFQGIREIPDIPVLYARVFGGYEPERIKPAFQEVYDFACAEGLLQPGSRALGIGLDDPDYTPWERCRYDACLEIPRGYRPPPSAAGLTVKTIAGGTYGAFRFRGPAQEFRLAWGSVFHRWVTESAWIPDHKPQFEIYLPAETAREGIFLVDLLLPVTRRFRKI